MRLGGRMSERPHKVWLFTHRDPSIRKDIEGKKCDPSLLICLFRSYFHPYGCDQVVLEPLLLHLCDKSGVCSVRVSQLSELPRPLWATPWGSRSGPSHDPRICSSPHPRVPNRVRVAGFLALLSFGKEISLRLSRPHHHLCEVINTSIRYAPHSSQPSPMLLPI